MADEPFPRFLKREEIVVPDEVPEEYREVPDFEVGTFDLTDSRKH